ncbi:MAG: ATP-binding cassette domain-containing protein, partial [Pseudomonadota bacterium]
MAEPLLRVEGLGVHDAAAPLLQGVSFQVEPAALTAVIGPDDGDKDALVAALTGRRPCDRGTLRFAGRPITRTRAALRVRAGLVATARQPLPVSGDGLVETVVVAMTGCRPLRAPWWRRSPRRAQTAAAEALLRFVGLGDAPATAPRLPDGAARARLTLACALAVRPRLLLVDRL